MMRTRNSGDLRKVRYFVFVAGALITVIVSSWLYVVVLINDLGSPNPLAMFIVLGAPFAYWLAWVGSSNRLLRIVAPVLYLFAVGFAIFSVVILLYLPGLAGLLFGTPDLNQQPQPDELSG